MMNMSTRHCRDVFPTGVGMNRDGLGHGILESSVPHGRGDEPMMLTSCHYDQDVFPTGVGMNRVQPELCR